MIKPNLLTVFPTHMDYPLFRYNLTRFRKYFNEVIIAFSPGLKDRNMEPFIRRSLKDCIFVTPGIEFSDWRQNAVRAMLRKSCSDYILFTEQDFFVKNESFFDKVFKNPNNQFIGYKEGNRIHPAFALIKVELLYLTSKDFSAYPDEGMDHFGKFFKELQDLVKFRELKDFGLEFGREYFHMSGLTQNVYLFKLGRPFYKAEEFLTYNYYIQRLSIPQSQEFMSYCEGIEKAYGNPDNPVIKSFFP